MLRLLREFTHSSCFSHSSRSSHLKHHLKGHFQRYQNVRYVERKANKDLCLYCHGLALRIYFSF